MVTIAIIIVLFLYFLPTIVGGAKRQGCAVFVLNLFLGWTLVGWVVALALACYDDPEPVKIYQSTNEGKMSQYDELEKLAELKAKGVISEEEFLEQKQKILGDAHNDDSKSDEN
jgi:hypothetical protein